MQSLQSLGQEHRTLDVTTRGTATACIKAGLLSHTGCLHRISYEQLGLGHSYLSSVLGWSPKKTILLI